MLLATVVATSQALAATRSRTTKRSLVAEVLAAAGPEGPDTIEIVATWLGGKPRQRRTGIGWRSLTDAPPAAEESTVTVEEVDSLLEELSGLAGDGSSTQRRTSLRALLSRCTTDEQQFLAALISENLRQGGLDSMMLDAIAEAAEVPLADVRRAATFSAETGPVAVAALTGGSSALASFTLVVGRPIRPMLASPAADLDVVGEKFSGTFAVDAKLDGIRVQVHRNGDDVRVFTRSLDAVTHRLPEVVAGALALPCASVVLDGEALTLGPDGRPRPFQETASRTASGPDETIPVTASYFDLLHLDGTDLMVSPAAERFEHLDQLVPSDQRTQRIVTSSVEEAQEFFRAIVASGHEGVVCKDLSAAYDAGRRGAAWLKVKPRHTLDLVVLAVEWGSGRRQGWLSNIHLGARDDSAPGGFVMLGKTFKGMTDEMLAWQTERFLSLEARRTAHVVHLRPEQVVEIAFDGVQRSTRYPGGVALRFARVLRYRDDKTAAEADTLDRVRALHR